VTGVMMHYPNEVAKRQAFLETRQCVQARLTTQKVNQQQVRKKINIVFHHVPCTHVNMSYELGEAVVVGTAPTCRYGNES